MFNTNKPNITEMHTKEETLNAIGRLLDVMDELREKCPWDHKQTFESLRPNTIEETYELCDAIVRNDMYDISKELGDVFMHIIFYSIMGSEQNAFDLADVANRLCDKLIYRHPHIYPPSEATPTEKVETSEQVLQQWEMLKQKERDGNHSVLGGVPKSLPSLIKACRIQEKARGVGFDWDDRSQVWGKVKEEISEFEAELRKADEKEGEEGNTLKAATKEFGDILFSLVNAARLYGINPDNALEMTNNKFITRFNYLEEKTLKQGRNLHDMTLEEMDTIWEEAKKFDN